MNPGDTSSRVKTAAEARRPVGFSGYAVVFAVASALLILMVALVSWVNFKQLKASIFWREHSSQVLDASDALMTGVARAHEGVCEYLLARDVMALKSCQEATNSAMRNLAALLVMTRDNPIQQQNLATISPDLNSLFEHSRRLAMSGSAAGTPEAVALEKTELGLMNKVMAGLGDFNREEKMLLRERERVTEKETRNLFALAVLGGGSALVSLGAAAFLAGRESRRRILAEVAQKELNAELLKTQALQNAILQSAACGLVSATPDCVITTFNAAAERSLGYSAAEAVGKMTLTVWHDSKEVEARARALSDEMGRRIEPGIETLTAKARLSIPDESEWTFIRKDGSRFPVFLSVTALRNERGEVTGFLGVIKDITERRAAEKKLRESEEHFRLIVQSVTDYAIFMLDTEGNVASWNAGAERIKGYEAADIVGRHFSAFYPPESILEGKPRRHLAEALANGQVRYEGWRLRKDGSRFYASVAISAIMDEHGTHRGFAKVTRDITESQNARERLECYLKEVNDLKAALDEHAIVSITDPSGNITYVNDKFCAASKYSRDELIGANHRIDNSGYHSREFFQEMWQTIGQGKTWKGQIRNRSKDGTFYWVASTIVPFFDASGKIRQFVAIRTDITQKKLAEEKLRESEERFRRSFDDAPIGMALVSLEGRWLRVNQAVCAIVGYSHEELLATDFQTITHPDDLGADLAYVSQLLEGEISHYEMEKRYFHHAGHVVHALLTVSLVRDEHGQPLYFISQIQDITDRKRIQAVLVAQTRELKRSNQELEQFAYVASHDMHEPLRAILGFANILKRQCGDRLDAAANQSVNQIVQGARRMADLIDDLLTLSRVGSQGKAFVRSDITEALKRAEQNLSVAINERGAIIRHDPLPSLPVDVSQLTLLFQNLIGNGIKFCRNRVPEIQVGATRVDKIRWEISVKDNGIGIQDKYFDRIFGVFQRLHTREEYPGTGIGLAVSKKIVERHGGQIRLESKPDLGTTFYFTLPDNRG